MMTMVQRVVLRKLSTGLRGLRGSISSNINIKEIHEKYTRRNTISIRVNDESRCERGPIERIQFILSPVIQLFGHGSKVQRHTGGGDEAVKVSPRFTILREQRPACSLSRTRSLLRIGPITKIQNTKYIIIINFFL